jgi:uncharacterized Zn-binding protein involved in type VI secretion
MYKKAVLDGDWTSTHGKVLADHAAGFVANGKRVAFSGSVASCGECKGTFPVIASYRGWTDQGRNMVLDQDYVACPCGKNHVIGSAFDILIEDVPSRGAYGYNGTGASAWTTSDPFDERFILRDSITGAPLTNRAYRLKSNTGQVIEDVTDASGRTARIKTTQAESYTLQLKGL